MTLTIDDWHGARQPLSREERGVNARLWTIGTIGHRDRAPSVAAQETGQADEPQEAEEAPFAGVSSSLVSVRRSRAAPARSAPRALAPAPRREARPPRGPRGVTPQPIPFVYRIGMSLSLLSIQIVHTGDSQLDAALTLRMSSYAAAHREALFRRGAVLPGRGVHGECWHTHDARSAGA